MDGGAWGEIDEFETEAAITAMSACICGKKLTQGLAQEGCPVHDAALNPDLREVAQRIEITGTVIDKGLSKIVVSFPGTRFNYGIDLPHDEIERIEVGSTIHITIRMEGR